MTLTALSKFLVAPSGAELVCPLSFINMWFLK